MNLKRWSRACGVLTLALATGCAVFQKPKSGGREDNPEYVRRLEQKIVELERSQAALIDQLKKVRGGTAAVEPRAAKAAKAEKPEKTEKPEPVAEPAPEKPKAPPKLSEKALFARAEAHFKKKRHAQAIADYEEHYERFPKSRSAPQALLKTGQAYLIIQDPESAKANFEELVAKFPKAPEAKKARARLAAMAPKAEPKPEPPVAKAEPVAEPEPPAPAPVVPKAELPPVAKAEPEPPAAKAEPEMKPEPPKAEPPKAEPPKDGPPPKVDLAQAAKEAQAAQPTIPVPSTFSKPLPPGTKTSSLEGTVVFEGAGTALSVAPASVVYVLGWEEDNPVPPEAMDQLNKAFIPNVRALTRGQALSFPNKDNVHHNVFSVSNAKTFDLGHTGAGETPSVTFNKTGVVDIYCNIHPEMMANVLVLPNRAFAVVDPKTGKFRIDGIPPGKKTVQAWNRQGKPQKAVVDFAPGQVAKTTFKIPITAEIPPHLDKHGKTYTDRKIRY